MAAAKLRPVYCTREGCSKTWDQDPALTVACPDCKAPPGSPCKRPSEHPLPFREIHGARDLAADDAFAYGPCPLGHCGKRNKEAREARESARQAANDPQPSFI